MPTMDSNRPFISLSWLSAKARAAYEWGKSGAYAGWQWSRNAATAGWRGYTNMFDYGTLRRSAADIRAGLGQFVANPGFSRLGGWMTGRGLSGWARAGAIGARLGTAGLLGGALGLGAWGIHRLTR